jgi:flagellar basal-body rod protein FlgF
VNRGLYSGVAAMNAAERRMDAITANLANLSATGYKRMGSATESFDAVLQGRVQRQVATRTTLDFSQGVLRPTGGTYDLALAGRGFFAVETPSGEAYTRNGQFHIDGAGVLVSFEGYPVAWDGGRGAIDPQAVEPTVDPEGQIWQGERRVGRLKIADFEDRSRLELDRRGYLHAPADLVAKPHEAEVRQGHLERANVSAVDEMVALIAVQRSFEAASRLMTAIDQSYRRLTARG